MRAALKRTAGPPPLEPCWFLDGCKHFSRAEGAGLVRCGALLFIDVAALYESLGALGQGP